jgi:hypothetical protein
LGTDQITHVSLQATSPHYCLRLTLCQSILVSRHLQCPLNGVWINVSFNAPKCCNMTSTWRDLELKKGASVYQSGNATAYSMQSTSTVSPNGSGRHPRMPSTCPSIASGWENRVRCYLVLTLSVNVHLRYRSTCGADGVFQSMPRCAAAVFLSLPSLPC